MKNPLFLITLYLVFNLTSCDSSQGVFEDAVAVWDFSGKAKEVQRTGGWLDAGQGTRGELNLTGKNVTLYTRVKATGVSSFSPILSKAGTDQNMAYRIALNPTEEGVFVEAVIGSDEIGGAHLLRYKLQDAELYEWHDILFRFNGEVSQLFVDGVLRDEEVTVGEIRDWNRRPLLIGAQYKKEYGYAEATDEQVEFTFTGFIEKVALWQKTLSDEEVMKLCKVRELKDGTPTYYTEKYRPQFHFTAKKHWLNDPNGLVYYDGVYHLFFQYMPPHRPGAYKDWGHAVSTDLVHWQQVPHHITPHKVWSGCWSGSAVVDVHNVAGFQTGDKKSIVAFLTSGGHPGSGLGPLCTQCIAYSTDGGMTFTYYDQNPVIRNIIHENRDPKVVWDEQSGKWIMSLFMDKEYDFGLFYSDDLKEWTYLSTISLQGVRECPGFEPLPVDGDPNNKKWMLLGANGDYSIGSFDGTHFRPETKVLRGDYGTNFYAGQTWSDEPQGRCIIIAWMPTQRYPGMPFEQQMNFPTEITLRTTPSGIKAFRMPVREIRNLYDKKYSWQEEILTGKKEIAALTGELYDFDLELDVSRTRSFEVVLRDVTLTYDAAKKTISCGGPPMRNGIIPDDWVSADKSKITPVNNLGEAPLPAQDGKISLRILLDRNTIEVFGNDGEVVVSSCFMPGDNPPSYSIHSQGDLKVVKAEVHSLKSAWNVQ